MKDIKKNKKKRIMIIGIFLLMLAMASLGVSLALLSKNTEKRANNFTFGNVKIELTEEKWDDLSPEDKIVYPNKTVAKDPVVTNTGKNDLYAYIEVKVPKKNVKTVSEQNTVIDNQGPVELFSFEFNRDDWTEIKKDTAGSDYNVYLYAYTAGVLPKGESTSPLFEEVTYLNILEGEIPMDTKIEMPVTAYAIQSEYLNESGNDLTEKMKDAFDKYTEETAE